jgi:hypothetical protein
MPSQRKRKSVIEARTFRQRRHVLERESQLWDRMDPVGREFGSPDFERLMAEDHRDGVGVFDPALKRLFPKAR